MSQYNPRVPWLHVHPYLPGPGYSVVDQRTGQSHFAPDERVVHQIAARLISDANRAAGRSGGLGDVVKGIASALGFKKQCTPCAQRQAAMNAWSYRR